MTNDALRAWAALQWEKEALKRLPVAKARAAGLARDRALKKKHAQLKRSVAAHSAAKVRAFRKQQAARQRELAERRVALERESQERRWALLLDGK